MTTLTTDHLLSRITVELSGLPYDRRVAAVRAYALVHLILDRNPIMIR